MIDIQRVSFSYSEQDFLPALQNVSLQIHEGETIAIIGHNGSGKSTLTKLLAAMLFPQSGSILVDGLRTDTARDDIWTIRQRVGMVFQNPDDQLIASTVVDDIAFGPENLGLPRAEIAQRVQEALELLDLTELAQLPISELPVSLKQRVTIAGVLAMRPRYLLLDEPTTMISGHTARQVLHTVRRLARERSMAVIHITHFMHEVIDFDRVIVMDAGRVLMDGTPETVFARADELQTIGLDVPLVTQLGRHLTTHGWPLPAVVLHPDQLLNTLAQTQKARPTAVGEAEMDEPQSMASTATARDSSANAATRHRLFDVQHLSYTYQHNTPFARTALRDLTLRIDAGRTTALVGPTAAGKSTLIDLLGGLIKPHAGVLLFEGVDTAAASFKLTRLRSRVGIVFQSPESQIFEETVGKDVSFGPRQQHMPLAESRRLVQESLQAMGLPYEDFRSRYTYALSGGQKRRVAIAGVLAQQPEVIIFDEPMAGLDPRGRNELFKLIASLKQRTQLTIVYASSSLQDVVEIADVIHVLESGRVALSGTPREILAQAETLHALDIALPEATRLSLALRQGIPELPTAVLNLAELEAALEKELPELSSKPPKK